jgi:hypothetical protein
MNQGGWGPPGPSEPSEDQRWLSAANAADIAGVTPGTVRYWAHNGLIASRSVPGPLGDQVLVRLDEVKAQAGGAPVPDPARPAPPPPPPVRGAEVRRSAPTAELAPIFKTVSELMSQLTDATERAARAETKFEFLSEQASRMRERVEVAERAAAELAEAPEAEPTQVEPPEEDQPPPPMAVTEHVHLDAKEGEDSPEFVQVQVEERPAGIESATSISIDAPHPPAIPQPAAPPETTPAPEPVWPPEITATPDPDPEPPPEEDEVQLSPEQLFQGFLERLSKADAIRRGAIHGSGSTSRSAERFREGFLKGISDVEDPSEPTDPSNLWPSQEDIEVARSASPSEGSPSDADLWGPPPDGGTGPEEWPPYEPIEAPPPPRRRKWGRRR